jgi:hypothetical protein
LRYTFDKNNPLKLNIMTQLDLTKDQNLFSIRKNGEVLGYIEIKDGKIVTEGIIGENTYDNFVELIKGLQGFDIEIDNFYW